jgi:phosphoribosylformylglycinamidine synthase
VCGFLRSFGLVLPDGERREYVKPIMFSAGIGAMDFDQVTKLAPERGSFGNFFSRISKNDF